MDKKLQKIPVSVISINANKKCFLHTKIDCISRRYLEILYFGLRLCLGGRRQRACLDLFAESYTWQGDTKHGKCVHDVLVCVLTLRSAQLRVQSFT